MAAGGHRRRHRKAVIRTAGRGDLKRIGEIRGAVRENRLAHPERIAADVAWLIDDGGFLVFELDGAVQGFAAADRRNGSIFALFVDPGFEGRGLGRALLAAACARLAAKGHAKASLTTGHGTRAERFYRRGGWTATGLTDDGQIIFEKSIAA